VIKDGRATGVEYERRGKLVTAHARREVVLSAGAFGTPHLLQLSGIGDAAHLASIGVDCIVDNAHVGAHLAEHPLTLVNWELTAGHVGLFDAKKPKYLLEWLTQHGGKLSSNVAEAVAHVKTLPDLRDPDFQLLFGPTFFWENGAVEHPVPCAVIGQSYWTPASEGWVRAATSDPRSKPHVALNMFAEQSDVDAMIRAIRLAREIAATAPLTDVLGKEVTPGAAVQTDAELEEWVRNHAEHTYHPSCTARMGAEGEGVLDERLRVRGVSGLRVADTSALPRITHANTNAPAILVGEKCAEFIRAGN
jgi:choline dehydrogenase